MSSRSEADNGDVLNALIEFQQAFAELDELCDRYRAQAAEARAALKAKALIRQSLKEGSPRSLAKAEVAIQDLAERYLKD